MFAYVAHRGKGPEEAEELTAPIVLLIAITDGCSRDRRDEHTEVDIGSDSDVPHLLQPLGGNSSDKVELAIGDHVHPGIDGK